MTKKAHGTCYLCGDNIATPEEVYAVSRNRTPKGEEVHAKQLHGQKLCRKCAIGTLRSIGYWCYNVAKARKQRQERNRQQAQSTVAQILARKNEEKGVIVCEPASQ